METGGKSGKIPTIGPRGKKPATVIREKACKRRTKKSRNQNEYGR